MGQNKGKTDKGKEKKEKGVKAKICERQKKNKAKKQLWNEEKKIINFYNIGRE